MSTATLPPPAEIRERIKLTRDELSALKKLLRASEAAIKADQARAQRSTPFTGTCIAERLELAHV